MTAGLLQTVSESSKNGPRVARVRRRKRPLGPGVSLVDPAVSLLHELLQPADRVHQVSASVPGLQLRVAIASIIM